MEQNIEEIVKKIQMKDEEAFRTFFYAFKPKLFYIAFKEVKNAHDAEDCVQEIFLKILRHIKEFDCRISKFSTWVFTIARNCIIDFMKLKNISKEKCVLNSFLVYCRGVQNTYDTEILLSEVERHIGELRYKVLTLKRGFELTFAEIAEQLNIHPSKAKTLYYEGYNMAKEYFNDKEKSINDKRK